ncbi:Glutamine-dependent NAD(+) synthetase [Candidatus Kinetoplastibacterium sorsogonicusi]|uniref:Glutamine-dependent NAD(+) synthetase n=1 Tax=Candidatus Kinetoplastidibacterium kentomonadis TaxID=1576550 RepID=A0A3S7J9R1_9PROT|nr:NAD+ synthase [Candidatus Kinetoplastibacterium sorsogonicusi]AWD32408.1 Glutamine-dependent NAD(+) synthetase [Candidatus Kinetoplastibacterium sorsogonicusi]
MKNVKIAIFQMNACVGDIDSNINKILENAKIAKKNNVNIFVTPELSLIGYPPYDLLLRKEFIDYQNKKLFELINKLKILNDLYVLIGHVSVISGMLYNTISIIYNGKIITSFYKNNLPNYSIFNEKRYFTASYIKPLIFKVNEINFGVIICEDLWKGIEIPKIDNIGVQVLLVCNASPYHINKDQERFNIISKYIDIHKCSLIYTNLVGGQDDLIFDGSSLAIDNKKESIITLPRFIENLSFITIKLDHDNIKFFNDNKNCYKYLYDEDFLYKNIWDALVLSLRDFVHKNNINHVIIGLSGGIDSALVLAIAVDALGKDKITTVMLSYKYTSQMSINDAKKMTDIIGNKHIYIKIDSIVSSIKSTLFNIFDIHNSIENDKTEENIQARVRGNLLMSLSNKMNAIVLNTSNKSEIATGYCTLYGDMIGAFSVLKDVSKTMVFKLAKYRNTISIVIPENIINRKPSAELKVNQLDSDSLPPYDILDGILENFIENKKTYEEIISLNYSPQDVKHVLSLVKSSEFKRYQRILGPILTKQSFSSDWIFPITNKFNFFN